MPRNPSEIARLYDELDYFKSLAYDTSQPKMVREAALYDVRKLEEILGIESKPYNSN